jgi:hypothetical protein
MGNQMIDPQFEALSLEIGRAIGTIATGLNDRGVVHAILTLLPTRDGCVLTIRKSDSVTEMAHSGSFAFKNDPEPGMVRIEISDARIPPGLPQAERVPASEINADTIKARIDRFVRDWLAG